MSLAREWALSGDGFGCSIAARAGVKRPLFFGRLLRVVFGIATLASVFLAEVDVLGQIGLGTLGLSFLVGGLIGNPGCEITAIPNLLFRTRAHCV
ncbi:MAG: hypothetical protein AB7U25_16060 [Vicinamibacterales bacterium]